MGDIKVSVYRIVHHEHMMMYTWIDKSIGRFNRIVSKRW